MDQKRSIDANAQADAAARDAWVQSLFTVPARSSSGGSEFAIPIDASGSSAGDDVQVQAVDGGEMKYEAAEHAELGNSVQVYDIDGTPSPSPSVTLARVKPKEGDPIDLTFGQLVFLGGDFFTTYGDHFEGNIPQLGKAADYKNVKFDDGLPICGAFSKMKDADKLATMEARLLSAVESLLRDRDGLLRSILETEEVEAAGVKTAEEQDGQVHIAYHDHSCGIPTDDVWKKASTGPFWSALKGGFGAALKSWGLYGWISFYNADHFGKDAETAYKVGHGLAIKKAREAQEAATDSEKQELLKMAYIIDGFCCHFLTDLFSAGHLRVPRRYLHCPSKEEMAAYYTLSRPVYDVQCRMCHDEDAALGLIVRNRKGDQWIAFGDKELSMPPNGLNKVRIIQCVQASVDEVFNLGFKGTGDIVPEKFAAVQLLPQAMTSFENADWLKGWDGFDRHNFKPIWRGSDPTKAGAVSWKTRNNIDDRSDSEMIAGSFTSKVYDVGSLVSKLSGDLIDTKPETLVRCELINSKLTSKDIYQVTSELRPDTGGFMQIQQLLDANEYKTGAKENHSKAESQLVNIWGPTRYEKAGEFKYLFTLRNRICDFYHQQNQQSSTPIHWEKFYDPSSFKTTILRFDYITGASRGLVVSAWKLGSDVKSLHADSQIVPFDTEKSWAFTTEKTAIQQAALISKLPAMWTDGCTNLTRFLLGRFSANSNSPGATPDILSVSFVPANGSNKARTVVGVMHTQDSMGTAKDTNIFDLEESNTTPPQFVKPLKGDSRDDILLTRFADGQKPHVRFDVLTIDSGNQTQKKAFEFDIAGVAASKCAVMTGSMTAKVPGSTEVLVAGTQGPPTTLTVFQYDGIKQEIAQRFQHKCGLSVPAGGNLVRSHFIALLDSESNKNGVGLDVLNVFVTRDSSSAYSLNFWVHRRVNTDTGVTTNADIWTECKVTQLPDALAGNPNYRSIKWVRCKNKTSKNAIMEIFSLHGILGCRAFFPKDRTGYAYTACGLHPFMGQTAVGMGRGCYGDWGYGFMTWGNTVDFVDIATGGGMTLDDLKRENIRGWEVEKKK